MKKSLWFGSCGFFLIAIVCAVLTGTVGGLAGAVGSNMEYKGAFVSWQRLTAPPQKPVEIVGAKMGRDGWATIHVKTMDNRIYSCRGRSVECWVETNAPANKVENFGGGSCVGSKSKSPYSVSNPPGKVVDRIQVEFCGADYGTLIEYAILDDGNVWMWNHTSGALAGLGVMAICAIGGALAGMALGAAIVIPFWIRWLARRNRQGSSSRAAETA
ncbi:hypothetical protein ANRL1_01164 [Anaerolineae bacterium]|nr:hypothetical protein ANRL1_01164 [Anaerolineae bacterium]